VRIVRELNLLQHTNIYALSEYKLIEAHDCCVATEACKGDSIMCEGEQRKCIRADQRCDGYTNCQGGVDEKNCGEHITIYKTQRVVLWTNCTVSKVYDAI
jgi:hypothetical protein